MSRFLFLVLVPLMLGACISRNTDDGLVGKDLYRATCPLQDSDETCARRALRICQAQGFSTVAGLTFGRQSRVIQNNCSVIGGIRICTPGGTTVKTATFTCTHAPA